LSCEDGLVYNKTEKICQPCPISSPIEVDGKCLPCPENSYYNETLTSCIRCEEHTVYNVSSGECEKIPENHDCTGGKQWNN
jgi:hypothetical protein